jgi:hypothetical protein
MNSTQLNFFIVPSDWLPIVDFFNSNDVKLITDPITGTQPLKSMSANSYNERQYTKTLILSHSTFHDNIFFDYNEETSNYSINKLKSYVIEFAPGGFYPNDQYTLDRGRFYCATKYYATNGEQIEKHRDFLNWVKRFYNLFKKQFLIKNGNEKTILFSRETMRWIQEKKGEIDAGYLKIKFGDDKRER